MLLSYVVVYDAGYVYRYRKEEVPRLVSESIQQHWESQTNKRFAQLVETIEEQQQELKRHQKYISELQDTVMEQKKALARLADCSTSPTTTQPAANTSSCQHCEVLETHVQELSRRLEGWQSRLGELEDSQRVQQQVKIQEEVSAQHTKVSQTVKLICFDLFCFVLFCFVLFCFVLI